MNLCSPLVTRGLATPTIVSTEDEFVLEPLSVFNISCTGKRNVAWVEPLPDDTFILPGYYTSTLFIYNASVTHTGYYSCKYQDKEGDEEDDEENEAVIYVFVPGKSGGNGCHFHAPSLYSILFYSTSRSLQFF